MLLVAYDTTIIGVAILKISTVFKSLDAIGWCGSAYLLTVTALQPTFGNMCKFFDVKTTYMISIFMFEVEVPPHTFPLLPSQSNALLQHSDHVSLIGSILCAATPKISSILILSRPLLELAPQDCSKEMWGSLASQCHWTEGHCT